MTDVAELGLKVDSSGVVKATKNLNKLDKQSGKNENSAKKLGATFKTLAITLGATALVTGAITKSIGQWRTFSSAISDLSAITGAVGKDLEYLKNQSLAIGEATTLSASQAATAFKLIASAKPDLLENAKALAEVTKQTVTLAEASGIELTAAANTVGSALNQFGAGAEEAARFVNVLAAGSKFGASEVTQTAEALREAGTVASSAGLSCEETNAALQQLGAVAIKGSQAGVALRNVIVNLRTRGVDATNPAIVGLSKALKNLGAEHLDTAAMAKLFGKENLAAGESLIRTAGNLGDMTTKLTGTATAMEQAATKVDNLDGDIKKLGSQWESAGITLGERFDPALRFTTQLLTDAAAPVKQMILEFTDLGDALGSYAAIAGAVLSFDLEAAKKIVDLRKQERAEIDLKIKGLYAEKKATDELNKSKAEGSAPALDPSINAAALAASVEQDQALYEAAENGHNLRLSLALQAKQTEVEQIAALQATADEQMIISQQMAADQAAAVTESQNEMRVGALTGTLGLMSQLTTSSSKKIFKLGKAASLASTAVSTYSAVIETFKNAGGYPWGIAPAAAMAAVGAVQMQNIKAQQFSGQAHDGMDRTGEGSYNLKRNEMVLDSGTSAKVRKNIDNATVGGNTIIFNPVIQAFDANEVMRNKDKLFEGMRNMFVNWMNEEGLRFS